MKQKQIIALLGGKSPLVGITKELIIKLQATIPNATVHMVMRYTPPFSHEVLEHLQDVDEVVRYTNVSSLFINYNSQKI